MHDLTEKMTGALSGFGGYLRCETCGTHQALGDAGRRVTGGGWPKCCGYTMRWWTQRQISAGEVPEMTAITAQDEAIERFARDVARYVTSHREWAEMSKEEAAREAIRVALTAPGAIEEAIACLAPHSGSTSSPQDLP